MVAVSCLSRHVRAAKQAQTSPTLFAAIVLPGIDMHALLLVVIRVGARIAKRSDGCVEEARNLSLKRSQYQLNEIS